MENQDGIGRQEPLEFTMRLADFDLDLLPIHRDVLKGNPELLRESVSQYFSDCFAKVGGKAGIIVTGTAASVTWVPASLADKESLLRYTMRLASQGAAKEAAAILGPMARRFPDDFAVLLDYGHVLIELGEPGDAVRVLKKAMQVSPENIDGLAALGTAYLKMGDRKRASDVLNRVQTLRPDDAKTLSCLGMAQKEPEKALPFLQRAVEIEPDNQDALLALGACLMACGRPAEADKFLAKAIEAAPYTRQASDAKDLLSKLAALALDRKKAIIGIRPDAVKYCIDALEAYAKMGKEKMQAVTMEIALLGREGLDVNNPAPKYTMKGLAGQFSGLQLLAYMYVGLKQIQPTLDTGVDFSREYEEARRCVQESKNRLN